MSINLALNKTATASSYVKPFQPSRAVDANNQPEFRWICNTLPGWLNVDLGGEYYINRWVVVHMGAAGWDSRYNTCNYYFQGSLDNTNWFTLDTVAYNTANTTDRTIAITKVRFVRVVVTGGIAINPQLASIVELQVYEAESSTSALTALSTNAGDLIPTFNKATLNYTSNVGFNVNTITVTPTKEDVNAVAKVNGVVVTQGQASQAITLSTMPGDNNIDILVTPAFGPATTTYKINAVSASNPYLLNLQIPLKTISPTPFVPSTLIYNATVNSTTASIKATAQDSNATITIGGEVVVSGTLKVVNLAIGENPISIKVASQIGVDERIYTLTITRNS